jgi:hypothetical protein
MSVALLIKSSRNMCEIQIVILGDVLDLVFSTYLRTKVMNHPPVLFVATGTRRYE